MTETTSNRPTENRPSRPSSSYRPQGGPRPQGGGRPGGGRPQGGRPQGGRPGGGRPQGGRPGGGYSGGGPRRRRFTRRKVCRFCVDGVKYIDYKNYRMLRDFLTERGKIMPRRITGNCAHHQRMLTHSIKRARNIALLSFVSR